MNPARLLAMAALFLAMVSCGGNKQASESTVKAVDDDTFYATQPVKSGQYRAVSYDIVGDNTRKGKFDGRVLISLSPEQSGMYVFENGNRAKIDYKLVLKKPFEKGDSGRYTTVDVNDLPVTITTDSLYVLSFEKGKNKISIDFDPTPMNTGSALEIMEKISAQIQKTK